MFAQLEDYINQLLFSVPMPLRQYPAIIHLILPNKGNEWDEMLNFE